MTTDLLKKLKKHWVVTYKEYLKNLSCIPSVAGDFDKLGHFSLEKIL